MLKSRAEAKEHYCAGLLERYKLATSNIAFSPGPQKFSCLGRGGDVLLFPCVTCEVDCAAEKALCNEQGVKTYPRAAASAQLKRLKPISRP